jgi:hypothetical protein
MPLTTLPQQVALRIAIRGREALPAILNRKLLSDFYGKPAHLIKISCEISGYSKGNSVTFAHFPEIQGEILCGYGAINFRCY